VAVLHAHHEIDGPPVFLRDLRVAKDLVGVVAGPDAAEVVRF